MKEPFTVASNPPTNSRGYPEAQLRSAMKARQFQRFKRWMRGQGIGLDSNGHPIYFTKDVSRFLRQDKGR